MHHAQRAGYSTKQGDISVRILITTDFYLPYITGVTTVVVNEQNILSQLGHEIRILTISKSTVGTYADGVYAMKGSAIQPFRDSQLTFSYNDPLLEDIYQWKAEVVHSNNEFITMEYARRIAKELKIPLVHTCHTDFTRYDAEQRIRHTLYDAMIAQVVRRRVRDCDILISPSLFHKNMLERYRIKNPILVLPSGIDLQRFAQPIVKEERDRRRLELGFNEDEFVLISVCRLVAEKRVEQTIDSFFLLSLLEPKARLLIVGGGPKEDALKKQVQDLGLDSLVVFTGAVAASEVHIYYKLADLFVSSSIRESQGLGFVEAMASSLVLLLQEDYSLGLCIEELDIGRLYDDAHSFVMAVSSLLEKPQKVKEMGEKAKEVSKRFSLENWGEKLSGLLKKSTLDFCYEQHHRRHDDQR